MMGADFGLDATYTQSNEATLPTNGNDKLIFQLS